MKPIEKLEYLKDKYRTFVVMWSGGIEVERENIKQCVSITIDEMIKILPSVYNDLEEDEIYEFGGVVNCGDGYYEYWEKVKEINKTLN